MVIPEEEVEVKVRGGRLGGECLCGGCRRDRCLKEGKPRSVGGQWGALCASGMRSQDIPAPFLVFRSLLFVCHGDGPAFPGV